MPKYIVVNENVLGYRIPEMGDGQYYGILHASILRGSILNDLDGAQRLPMDASRFRPATAQDFAAYRVVVPPDHPER